MPNVTDPNARFDARVDFQGPYSESLGSRCWLWTGGKKPAGYGVFHTGGFANRKTHNAHRWNFERHRGPIQAGLTLDHLCRVRNCVNPAHLEPVTQAVNNARGNSVTAMNARKTHCAKGHPLAEGNLVKYDLKRGMRSCRICYNAKQAARRARTKEKAS